MHFIETGHHQIHTDRNPDLSAHGVVAGAEEGFDPQVLLDPFKEEFDLPAPPIDGGNYQSRQLKIVGEESQTLAGIRIDVADPPEPFWVRALTFGAAQPDYLVAAQAGGFIHRSGFENMKPGVDFRADHEGCTGHFNLKQPCEVKVAAVKNVDTSCLVKHLIHEIDVMHATLANPHKYRDCAGKVDLGMEFDGRLGFTKTRPREHRKAQINSGRVHSVDHLADVQPIGIGGMQMTGLADQDLSQCLIDAPVPVFVGIGQIGASDVPANTHCMEMGATTEAGFHIPEALAKSDLSEGHREKLVACTHGPADPGHGMQFHAAIELLAVDDFGDLGEKQTLKFHPIMRMGAESNDQSFQSA